MALAGWRWRGVDVKCEDDATGEERIRRARGPARFILLRGWADDKKAEEGE